MNLDAELIRRILDYNSHTGEFTWNRRPLEMFANSKFSKEHSCAVWNTKHAGKLAGSKHTDGWVKLCIFGKSYAAHRIAWLHTYGYFPYGEIDHKDGNNSNNSLENLRLASRSENMRNTSVSSANSSGVKGVGWNKNRRKWQAYIKVNCKQIYLGLFETMDDAAIARAKAEITFHGEFARAA